MIIYSIISQVDGVYLSTNMEGLMDFNWKNWSNGQKLIFVSSAVAVASLLLPWADMGLISVNGFAQQGYLLLVFFIYPLYQVLKSNPIKPVYGFISSCLAVICSISFALSKTVEVFETSVNLSGSGLVLFIICSITLVIGVYMAREQNK